jgi:hypothetical protein
MSLVRRTSVAALAVTGCTILSTLALVTTLLASGASSTAAGRSPAAGHAPRSGAHAAKAEARWVAGHTSSGQAKIQRQTARREAHAGARFTTFRDRVLGGQPLLSYRGAADPTVARYAGGWVAVSTGPSAPRATAPQPGGPWQNIPSALLTRPTWALSQRFWASDLVEVDGVWLLYFTAEVAGLGLDGRCIGVATAADPTQPFVPDERPLVCPKQAAAPAAYDRIKRRGRDLPDSGVIDPDYFKDRDGRQYLLYRTQSTPSSIRIVKLPRSGRPVGKARSTELVRRSGVIENPTMLRRGRQYVLLASEGEFGECSYKTTFRRSTRLTDWSRAKRQVLVDTKKSGLCGPGGADVSEGPNGEPLLFLHAWTCPALGGNCPGGHNYDRDPLYDARRAMFGGVLRFTSRQSPRIAAYLTPILPPPPPTATPTPTPTGPTSTVSARGHRNR